MNKLKFWSVAWPIGTEMVMIYGVAFIDMFFLSRISDSAAGAFGAINPLLIILVLVLKLIAQGGGVVAARYVGAGDRKRARDAYMFILTTNIGLGAVAAGSVFALQNRIGDWLGLTGETADYAREYLSLYWIVLFAMGFRVAYAAIAASIGMTRWSMMGFAVGNLFGITLNCTFAFGWFGAPHLGVHGVLAAACVNYIVNVIVLGYCVHRKMRVRLALNANTRARFREMLRPVLSTAIPMTLEPVLFNTFQLALTTMIVRMGTESLAARTYALQISTCIMFWSLSIGQATQILTANRIGARAFDQAYSRVLASLRYAILGVLVWTTLVYLNARTLYGLFTTDPAVIHLGVQIAAIGFVLEIGRCANVVCAASLGAAGDAKFPASMGIIFNWFVGLPLCWYIGVHLGYGLLGIWIGMTVEECTRGCCNFVRWHRRGWMGQHLRRDTGGATPA
ncbi:MATE family efflux transporter [Pararobbsia silviterrae]|uniref:MATE family efflux transporter n=1 Tax=Pararobbsia silviterrae TaxID=1792498 RepID=A0A494XY24_9BURK|nr:MATE family efflux transporter [Pararobbsia silviterrae]RKP54835.1 MATE family efflux transporter [Pararobbsia silviterrae]